MRKRPLEFAVTVVVAAVSVHCGEASPPRVADAGASEVSTPRPDAAGADVTRADVLVADDATLPDAALPDATLPDALPTDGAAVDVASDQPPVDAGGSVRFRRFAVDAMSAGPAFVTAADVDRDGRLDLVVSRFGAITGLTLPAGEVSVYTRAGASLDAWTRRVIVPASENVRFPNHVTVGDVDGDGDMDAIVPSGFLVCTAIPGGLPCGGLGWYEQLADGAWRRHDVVARGSAPFYHDAAWVDFDGDGVRDLVTVGEAKGAAFPATPDRAEAQWFKGTTTVDRFETTPRVIGAGLGSFPTVTDIDGDGDLDVASAEFFVADGSFAWMERTENPSASSPAGRFTRRVIDNTVGPSIQLALVPDLYGDGVLRGVGTNHTNTAAIPPSRNESAVFVFTPGSDRRAVWERAQVSRGIVSVPGSVFAPQAAPGVFGVGDIDGDGDRDIAVSGDGDPHLYWLEQTAPGAFTTRVLEERLPQAGGMLVVDLDGDGRNEIVAAGYENNLVLIYQRL